MRVAILSQYPLNEGHIVGGIEAVMVSLVPKLASFDDLDLHVVTCQGGVSDHLSTTWSKLPLYVRRRRRFGRLTFYVRDVSSLRRTLRDISPDIVHAQGIGLYTLAALASSCPHVVTMHGIAFREAKFDRSLGGLLRGVLNTFYERYCLARVKNLISINAYVEEELAHIGGFRGRVFRIANPVDERFFGLCGSWDPAAVDGGEPLPDGWRGEEGAATILYSGKVIPRKALLRLLKVLVQARKGIPQVTLRVAGPTDADPAYFAACRQFVAQQGLDHNVSFLGSLTAEEMVREYARCALLAMPSEQETAPVALAEAMAVGRPVIATPVGGIPYMVQDGQSGFLVDAGDTDGWVEALTKLLTNRGLWRGMCRRGRELAEEWFHPMQVARATQAAYYEVLGGQY